MKCMSSLKGGDCGTFSHQKLLHLAANGNRLKHLTMKLKADRRKCTD